MAESPDQANANVEAATGQVNPSTEQATSPTPTNIEVDREATDNDSTYGRELSTYTTSLTSSVLNYRHENGRTYHGYRDGAYLLPNDEDEKDRLDMIHEMMLVMLDRKLFKAPIKSPQRVIDLGTGTGIWAIQLYVVKSLRSPCWCHDSLGSNIITHLARINSLQPRFWVLI